MRQSECRDCGVLFAARIESKEEKKGSDNEDQGGRQAMDCFSCSERERTYVAGSLLITH